MIMAEVEMNGTGDADPIQAALGSLSEVEKEFADVELKYRKPTHTPWSKHD